MTGNAVVQTLLYFVVLTAIAYPLGLAIAHVYEARGPLDRVLAPIERALYRLAGVDPNAEMDWKTYARSALAFNLLGLLAVFVLQRVQAWLPLNPDGLGAVPPELAFDTAASFASNTDWQAYPGETTMSYATQMLALTVQGFVSAATGMAVLLALVRGLARKQTKDLGNFWVDLTRGTLFVLLPLSFVLALFLVSQGVVQTFDGHAVAHVLDPSGGIVDQVLARGPAASQIAIKQLGTNGGGFFNVNSAHPFENPTPLSGFVELLAIAAIPAALCFTFGELVRDRRQGWALFAAMTALALVFSFASVAAEQAGTPLLASSADIAPSASAPGGNMEGKELRFGITASALWSVVTTAASNGSVNAMHDSFTPIGGAIPMFLMQLGEVIYGGVGSGLYGMILFVLVAVFIAGLMVGRTPEYLGKKVEAFEMKMASLGILVPCALILVTAAIATTVPEARAAVLAPGTHGFSEILYAATSAGANNGSAFGGLTASGPFYAIVLGVVMIVARYWVMIAVLAIAGSLAAKKQVPAGPGTLATHTPLFTVLLVGTVILVGALSFVPALALGPVAEHLAMTSR